MKTVQFLLLTLIISLSAKETTYTPVDGEICSEPVSIGKSDLHKDSCGNIYLRVVSYNIKRADEPDTLYISVVYSDSFGPDGVKNISAVVDTESFETVDADYYRDKNHTYYLQCMYEGATLQIVEMQNGE